MRRATISIVLSIQPTKFLSTLSLRRATRVLPFSAVGRYFYPRSPCGERLVNTYHRIFGGGISIHALLAESDGFGLARMAPHAYFYPRSPCGERRILTTTICTVSKFLSTLSLRRATRYGRPVDVQLVFLSTLSLRRATGCFTETDTDLQRFLSTLSLRRATASHTNLPGGNQYFYPRSPCGERPAGRFVLS